MTTDKLPYKLVYRLYGENAPRKELKEGFATEIERNEYLGCLRATVAEGHLDARVIRIVNGANAAEFGEVAEG